MDLDFSDLIPSGVNPTQRAFLNAMSVGESPGYNVMYGGRQFQDYADHPRQNFPITSGPNAGKTSSAAGRYQFLQGTWDRAKGALGLPDFSPDNQDKAAVWLAQTDYRNRTGRDLWKDVESAGGDPNKLRMIGGALAGTWTSLPGGIEPNKATAGFGQRFAQMLSGQSTANAAGAPPGPGTHPYSGPGAQFNPGDIERLGGRPVPQVGTTTPYSGPGAQFNPGDVARLDARGQTRSAQSSNLSFDDLIPPQAAPQPQPSAPQMGGIQRIAGGMANVLPAASQGTSPNIEHYSKDNLISAETFQGDDGSVLFRDPKSGQVIPTDKSKHVALRDPADNTVKIYARTEATSENPAVGVARVLAPGMMAGAPTARAAIPAAGSVTPKASDIFSTAKPAYREFQREASQIPVPPQAAAAYGERIKGALGDANFIEELAPQVYSALKTLDTGGPVALDHLQKVKRVIGRSFNSPDKNVRDAASVASAELGKIMAEVSPAAAQNLKTADAIHSTARSVQDLQRKSDVAGLRAGRAGYGGNAVNTMRQVLTPIVQRAVEGRTTGFKPNEIAAMREIVEGTTATNAARLVGQLSPTSGLGVLKSAAAGGSAVGVGVSGGTALAIPAIGYASNKLATILTGKQIDRLKEIVAKRSPAYSEAVAKSVERYEKAQMELVNNPSPNKLAGYISASRALSSGLTRDGIQVSSGDLLRAIQVPMKSAAEGEEPAVPGRPGE